MALTAVLALTLAQQSVQPPNIIVIFSDDHARQAISAYGSKLARTPGIDRLAKEGTIFRRHYTSNPICAPSRATLLTGKYSHANGHKDNASTFDGSQETLPKLLRQAGYESAVIGKWHLESKPVGFDHWEILPGQGDYYNPRFLTQDGDRNESGYVSNVITEKALAWMGARRERPWFLLIGHKAPHRTWVPRMDQLKEPIIRYAEPPTLRSTLDTLCSAAKTVTMNLARDLRTKEDLMIRYAPPRLSQAEQKQWLQLTEPADKAYEDELRTQADPLGTNYQRYLRHYLEAAQGVDDGVSTVLDYLDKHGLAKNTIVIYASDQGFFLGENGWYDKRWFYEPSAGTPLIIRGPGVKKQDISQITANVDLAPTVLDLAGVKPPKAMQGASLLPLTRGIRMATLPAYGHFYESEDGDHKAPQYVSLVTDRFKIIFYYQLDEWEIFDLESDPNETKNLWPSGVSRTIRSELVRKLVARQRQLNEEPQYIRMTESSASKVR